MNTEKPTILFLYSELADYFVNAAKVLAQDANVVIVCWPVNKEAPFKFNFEGLTVVQKDEVEDLAAYVREQQPSALVVSGWMDRSYVKVAKSFKKSIPVVLTLDNHWKGSWRQRVWSLLAPFKLLNIFSHAWVPGEKQYLYAQRLGFQKIMTSFYVANTQIFGQRYRDNATLRTYQSRQILYVGRYVEHKGIFELWNAFAKLHEKYPEWTLKCVGAGEEWDHRKKHDAIQHVGFVQPEQLAGEVAKASFVVIPSKFEPWGVVVQEMAISGMPLIVSDAVGAATTFVHDENGMIVKTDNLEEELGGAMEEMIKKAPDELKVMGQHAHEVGLQLTPQKWANKILRVIEHHEG